MKVIENENTTTEAQSHRENAEKSIDDRIKHQ